MTERSLFRLRCSPGICLSTIRALKSSILMTELTNNDPVQLVRPLLYDILAHLKPNRSSLSVKMSICDLLKVFCKKFKFNKCKKENSELEEDDPLKLVAQIVEYVGVNAIFDDDSSLRRRALSVIDPGALELCWKLCEEQYCRDFVRKRVHDELYEPLFRALSGERVFEPDERSEAGRLLRSMVKLAINLQFDSWVARRLLLLIISFTQRLNTIGRYNRKTYFENVQLAIEDLVYYYPAVVWACSRKLKEGKKNVVNFNEKLERIMFSVKVKKQRAFV
ncbi:hypothetical protein ACOME3_007714 [Neoechinorhynchus agilis]